ncbi:MAG: hypothetical protein HYV36_03770 [Lentisphaerae bacterium]|nr:hypothetical protein [Lentisphaerota bacterium]
MKIGSQSFAPEFIALVLLAGLPLLGVLAGNLPLARYLEFPPLAQYVEHCPFAWPVFFPSAILIVGALIPFIMRILLPYRKIVRAPLAPSLHGGHGGPPSMQDITSHGGRGSVRAAYAPLPADQRRFPGWGWLGVAFGIVAWILAWTRFEWFATFQRHTFSPLWVGYIITVNALTWRRTRACMLTDRPRYFLLLFPVSALFWWFFEYLNRFVQNWHYVGIDPLMPLEYFIYATLPFATVLPAVMGTCYLLATYPRLYAGLDRIWPIAWAQPRPTAIISLLIFAVGLAGLGLWPNYLFPLLWLAPLGILTGIQVLAGRTTLFAECRRGDWRRTFLLAISALICGFFWEMWNYNSLAKWVYAVPFVNRFHIFEMPVLGYAGYLPFGLECAVIADRVAAWSERWGRGEAN